MFKKVTSSTRLCIAVMLFLTAPFLSAQDRGAVSGRVTDPVGAIAKNAQVSIVNEETGVTADATTNESGEYTFSTLNAGRYTVTITAAGFEKVVRQHIQVDVGSRVSVDAKLVVGKTNVEVTVQSEVQQLSYNSANLGMTIEQKSITDLPLIYGNPFALEFLTPGVTFSGVNPNLHVYDSGTANVSVNGSSLNSLDYKLDGAPDNRIRFSAFTPSTEFISQYRVSTASYDATQGHSSGGFVNVQTKSGTSQFHGSVFGYYQNPKVNANIWALNPTTSKPVFVREGGGIGGPIIKEKLFFFAGYEHSRQGNPNVQLLSVPTAAEQSGDFSALLALDTTSHAQSCGATSTTLTGTTAAPINKYQIFDPYTAVATTGSNYARKCLPGNIVPASRISSIAKALMAYYPAPNLTGLPTGLSNYNYSAVEPDNYYGTIARFDYNLSQRQNLYAHILRSSRQQVHSSNWFPPVSGTHLDYENRGVAVGHTLVLGPSAVLNTVVSYTRFTNQNMNTSQGQITPTTIGMPSYLVTGLPASAQSLPRIDLTGYTSASTSSAVQAADDIWLGSVSISKQTGPHYFRFGGEYRRYLTNAISGSGEQGAYVAGGSLDTVNNTTSNSVGGVGFSVAQVELGLLTSGSQTQNSDFAIRSDYYAGFFQDDWRVMSRLTVNVGLRWEYESPDVERNNKEAVAFNFSATNSSTVPGAAAYAAVAPTNALLPATINPTGGFVFANTNGAGKDPYNASKNNYSPRIGFSFAATQKLVIRGGYGIFFDSLNSYYLSGGNAGSTTTYLVPQQGYSSVSNVTAPSYAAATGLVITSTLANPFPTGLTPVTGNSLGTSTALGQNVQFLQPNPHTPYNQRWSLGFQRQLGQFIAAIDYVGNHGVHLPAGQISQGTNTGGREYNNVPVQYYSTVDGAYDQAKNIQLSSTTVTNPFAKILPAGSANSLSSATIGIAQLLRPYPEYASINAFTTDGMSMYHSLQAQLQRRFSGGLSFTGAFTWSRTLDATTFLNPTDVRPWYGVSSVDRPLRFSTSGIYELPWGSGRRWLSSSHGIVAQVVGGWQIQGVYQIQSGAPLTFARNDVWYGDGSPGNSHWSRADYKKSIGSNGIGYWFDTSKWLQVAGNPTAVTGVNAVQACTSTAVAICPLSFPGTYQIRKFPLRFNTLRADNLNQADVGLQRQFQIWKLGALQFRGEAINVLNHPVYTAPVIDPQNAQFGQIISQANQPRVFQFAGFFRF